MSLAGRMPGIIQERQRQEHEAVRESFNSLEQLLKEQKMKAAKEAQRLYADTRPASVYGTSKVAPTKRRYLIEIRTGNQLMAGTHSDVRIQLFGTESLGEPHILQGDETTFRRGTTTQFVVEDLALGDITALKLEHLNNGDVFSNKWFVQDIKVTDLETKVSRLFPCRKWLGSDVGNSVFELSPSATDP